MKRIFIMIWDRRTFTQPEVGFHVEIQEDAYLDLPGYNLLPEGTVVDTPEALGVLLHEWADRIIERAKK